MALRRLVETKGVFRGTTYIVMKGDGNCLYSAIALAMYGDAELYYIVKTEALGHFSENWDKFKITSDHCSPENYLENMSQERVWGGFNEVSALSDLYKRRFFIICYGKKSVDIGPVTDPHPICLRYNGVNHYDLYSCIPKGFSLERDGTVEPCCESTVDPKLSMVPTVLLPKLNFGDWPALGDPNKKRKMPPVKVLPTRKKVNINHSVNKIVDQKLLVEPFVLITPLDDKVWSSQNKPFQNDRGSFEKNNFKVSVEGTGPFRLGSSHTNSDDSPPVISDGSSANDYFIGGDSCSSSESWSDDDEGVLPVCSKAACSGSNDSESDGDDPSAASPTCFPRRRPGPWKIPCNEVTQRPKVTVTPGIRVYSKCALMYGDEDLSLVKPVYFGNCSYVCEWCGAKFWQAQIPIKQRVTARCCNFGDFYLEKQGEFRDPSPAILGLYDGSHSKSKHFLNFIIAYNKIFSTVFASGRFGYADRGLRNPHCLRVNGEIKYVSSPFQTATKRRRADGSIEELPGSVNHGHVYFLDLTVDAVKQRITNSTVAEKLDEEIVMLLERYLRNNNDFIKYFQIAKEVYEREKENARADGRDLKEVVLVVNPKSKEQSVRGIGTHTYRQKIFERGYCEQPVNDFIAAVFTGDVPEYSYDLKYFPRKKRAEEEHYNWPHVSHSTLDVQMYPLLHLHGEFSHIKSRKKPQYSPTISEYVNFRLGRRDKVPILFKSRRLFLHWLINAEIRREYNQLEYYRLHQVELRLDTYKSIRDYAARAACDQHKQLGRVIIIPPTFEGTTKHRREVFLDFITILSKFGRASYFVTFTTNTQWLEIQERNDEEGTHPKFRPDINNDVFMMKFLAFMSDIVLNQIFGRVAAYFTVFEAQNRLLMHAHSIFIMEEGDRPLTPEDVDRVVWAHLPDQEKYPDLFALVSKFHIHGPCSVRKGGSNKWMCKETKTGKCRYDYPMPYRNATCIDARKPAYRRPNDGRGFYKKLNGQTVRIDNKWVVPYNPFCLLKYENNQAFEFFPKQGVARYLAKYFTKANHTENVHITQKNADDVSGTHFEYDEVKAYKEMRTLGGCEAHFRLTGNSLFQMSISVEKLPVHLEGEENMVFHENQWVKALNRDSTTKLTAWFKINKPNHPHYLENREKFYYEVVERHEFKGRTWDRTKSPRRTIGRICTVEPNVHSMELFYMRMLLNNKPGSVSFADIRKIKGITYGTYQEACVALGLLDDDDEVIKVLTEIEAFANGFQLRRVFCSLLVYATPKKPLACWYKFADALSQDHFFKIRDREQSLVLALRDMQSILIKMSRSLECYGIPLPESFRFNPSFYPAEVPGRPIPDHTSYIQSQPDLTAEIKKQAHDILVNTSLNFEQLHVFQTIIDAIEGKSAQKLFFLCAAAGTGKTVLVNYLSAYCIEKNIAHRNVAFTGLASTLLLLGETAHRVFRIPLRKEDVEATSSQMRLHSKEADELRKIKYFVWDECSMICAWQLEVVDHLLRTLKKNDEPFGGVVVVLAGDLRQLLPVIKGASRPEVVAQTVMASRLWHLFESLTLSRNMRLVEDEGEFGEWLLGVSEGRFNVPGTDEMNLPSDMLQKSLDDLISFVFPHFDGTDYLHSVIMCPTNVAADRLNNVILDLFAPEMDTVEFLSANHVMPSGADNVETYDEVYLQNLSCGSIPLHKFVVKKGAPVLLLRNLQPSIGLCNGAKMIVKQAKRFAIECEILNGIFAGTRHWIHRIYFDTNEFGLSGTLRRKQFPLRLAFALTINRVQGQTVLKKCGLALSMPPFTHEMLYVALSRATCKENVSIYVEESEGQGKRNKGVGGDIKLRKVIYTRNPIFFEILAHIPKSKLHLL